MDEFRTSSDRISGDRARLNLLQHELHITPLTGRITGGVCLFLLGLMGRSRPVRYGFMLSGGALIWSALSSMGWSSLGDRKRERMTGKRLHGVMKEDELLARQRTRGGGVPDQEGIKLIRSILINRPREEVYEFWKNVENLPRFLDHVESIHKLDDRHSHWILRTPAGAASAEWYMEIINDHPGELLAWQSLPGSDLPNAGTVRFASAPDGGTIVRVTMEYQQPTLEVGAAAAEILGDQPDRQLMEDLSHLKYILESGEEVISPGTAEEATV